MPSCGMHMLYKILYFADREHLVEYGRPITGDDYIAMQYGPVPSFLKDAIRSVKETNPYFKSNIDAKEYFEVVSHFVGAKRQCNIDYLSESDIECIDNAIEKLKDTDFDERTTLSHDAAWEKAKNDFYNEISPIDMASAGGANFEMLKYIQTNIENQNSFSYSQFLLSKAKKKEKTVKKH